MNNLIVLAAVTVALYGKAQCCCKNESDVSKIQQYCCGTYDACAIQDLQYNDSITCPSSSADAAVPFIDAASLLTNKLTPILNNTIINDDSTFLVNHVSL